MARKIVDTYPVFTVTVGADAPRYKSQLMTREQALDALAEFLEILRGIQGQTFRNYDLEHRLHEDARCEHCNWAWTEQGTTYNGGCCAKDEANSPDRLGALQSLIDEVEGADFYRWDADHGRDRVKVDWPWALACAADAWLKAGRQADQVDRICSLAKRVKASDWCTLWEDPGPSGCSLARLPDQVAQDARPENLAFELLSLIEDMGLTVGSQGVAA